MGDSITVVLADHHALLRQGLRALLEAKTEIRVIGEAANGRQAVEQTRELKPDVLVIEVTMPELNGIEAARLVRTRYPHTQVAVLSGEADAEFLFRAFDAGANAYLLKISEFDDIAGGIRAASEGRRYVCECLRESAAGQAALRGGASPLESLSARERQVLQLVAEGHTS